MERTPSGSLVVGNAPGKLGRRLTRSLVWERSASASEKKHARSSEAIVKAFSIAPGETQSSRSWLHWRPSYTGFGSLGTYRMLYICTSAVAFANAMTFSALGPFLPAYAHERFGASASEIGLMMAAYPLLNLITSPCCGTLMNRCGRWNVLFAGLCLLAAATALYGLAASPTWLYIASGMHGASLSLVHVSSLALLSAFPERLTEAMGGIEIWSGVALIAGPPLGGLVYPRWGVQGVFLFLSLWPLAMICFIPTIRAAIAVAKDGAVESGPALAVPVMDVLRCRGTLAAAFVTVCNYGVIGFLEVTLSPHLDAALGTTPSTIGFVFILPSVLYSVVAANAESLVEQRGAKRVMLWGFAILSASLYLHGPSPFLKRVLTTPTWVRFAVASGMLSFQVGSALAVVPAFAAMQGGVAHLGRGADNLVASMHSLAIGAGEVVGPIVGGFMMEIMPATLVLGCHPRASSASASSGANAAVAAVAAATAAAGGGDGVPTAADAALSAVRDVTEAVRRARRRLLEAPAAAVGLGGGAAVAAAPPLLHNHHGAVAASSGVRECISAFPAASSIVATMLLMAVLVLFWAMPPERKEVKGGDGEEAIQRDEEGAPLLAQQQSSGDTDARHRNASKP